MLPAPRTLRTARRLVAVMTMLALLSAPFLRPDPVAAVLTHTVSITPTTATAGVATSFTVTVTNNSTAPQTDLQCVRVAVPAGVTLSGTPSVAAEDPPVPPGTPRAWSAPTVVTGALQTNRSVGNANIIQPGGRVHVTFTATMAAAGAYVFTTTAFGQVNCSGQAYTISGPHPTVTVTAVNSAPVLNSTGTPSFSPILEDTTGHPGDSVPTLIASGGAGYITDVDAGALQGVAVIGADAANGTWEYSTNSGGSWAALGAVSPAAARLLASAATNRLRFVPSANYNGSATLTLRAWDRTSGTDGATASTTANGGTTAFSTATDTASIAVQPVNDAPGFVAGADQNVAEDSGPQTVVGWATGISIGPANEAGQTAAFSVTGNTNPGLFAAAPAVGATGTLTYTSAPNANGSANCDPRAHR